MALSDSDVENATSTPRTYRLRDGQGLFMEVSEGRRGQVRKWWRFRYWLHGKENLLSLGVYPDVSLQDARKARDDLRRLLAQGIDPSDERKARKAGEGAERLARLARETAERRQALSGSKVKVATYSSGNIEIWKGRNVLRLDAEEADWLCTLLVKTLGR